MTKDERRGWFRRWWHRHQQRKWQRFAYEAQQGGIFGKWIS